MRIRVKEDAELAKEVRVRPHVAHAGEYFGELGRRKGLYLRREDARVARVDGLVRYARGVARLVRDRARVGARASYGISVGYSPPV